MPKKKIKVEEFLKAFRCDGKGLPQDFFRKFSRINTCYREATGSELKSYILDLLGRIRSSELRRTKAKNRAAFENGWKDNLEKIRKKGVSFDSLKQGYFRGSRYFRYDNRLIIPDNRQLEYELFTMTRYLIFRRYLRHYPSIYELGCGSCQNLLLLRRLFPDKEIIGLDFTSTSSQIAAHIRKTDKDSFIVYRFDMLHPDKSLKILPGSAVFSIHSLEQLGRGHNRITDFILKSAPGIVVNYEPITEFYNGSNLLDHLAFMYSKHRGYLEGYLTRLHLLKKQGKIKILTEFRPYVGGVVHESSLVAWRPKD